MSAHRFRNRTLSIHGKFSREESHTWAIVDFSPLVPSKLELLSNRTRVTVRSISNLNLNRLESNEASAVQQSPPLNTLGSINSHVVVKPIRASQCQTTTGHTDGRGQTGNVTYSDTVNIREQLTDALCRRSHQPLTFMNRGPCCAHCRSICCHTLPCRQWIPSFPSPVPQKSADEQGEVWLSSNGSPRVNDAVDAPSPSDSGASFDGFERKQIFLVSSTTGLAKHASSCNTLGGYRVAINQCPVVQRCEPIDSIVS